jgi:hypothetical protein
MMIKQELRYKFIDKLTTQTIDGSVKWKQYTIRGSMTEYTAQVNNAKIILYNTSSDKWVLSVIGNGVVSENSYELIELIEAVESKYKIVVKEGEKFFEDYLRESEPVCNPKDKIESSHPAMISEPDPRPKLQPETTITTSLWREVGHILSFGLIKLRHCSKRDNRI